MSGRYRQGRTGSTTTRGPEEQRRAAAESRELDVGELRRIGAQVEALPPGPWEAVELSDFELRGPYPWDEDVEPSPAAHERREQLRRETAAWRGIRASDGTRVVGEPLRGGSPRPVVDPAWRFVADARTQIPGLLATLRVLWQPRARAGRMDPLTDRGPGARNPRPRSRVDVDRVAVAMYEAVPEPTRWRDLPELVRQQWRARAEVAIREVMGRGAG